MHLTEKACRKLENKLFCILDSLECLRLGVAVSGGGDSIALMNLAHKWAETKNTCLEIVTVDHNLRDSSEFEADFVKNSALELNLTHDILKWTQNPSGNLQNSARNARYEFILEWAKNKNLKVVLMGHNLDDQEETIMLRMIRGSGIDGLAGIPEKSNLRGIMFFRPLLTTSREELRRFLKWRNISWIEDPSNKDERFDRVKIRHLLKEVRSLGLSTRRLSRMAGHMSRARTALNELALRHAKLCVDQKSWGDLEIFLPKFVLASREVQLRILAKALCWISGKSYRPRFSSLERLLDFLLSSEVKTGKSLMGVTIKPLENKIILRREKAFLPKTFSVKSNKLIWDNRWSLEIDMTHLEGYKLGPLGAKGLREVVTKSGKSRNVPSKALEVSVALYKNEKLVCAPLAEYGTGLRCDFAGGGDAFFNTIDFY